MLPTPKSSTDGILKALADKVRGVNTSHPTPKTNLDKFLVSLIKKFDGVDSDMPTPLSNTDYYLKDIVENFEQGSGVVSDESLPIEILDAYGNWANDTTANYTYTKTNSENTFFIAVMYRKAPTDTVNLTVSNSTYLGESILDAERVVTGATNYDQIVRFYSSRSNSVSVSFTNTFYNLYAIHVYELKGNVRFEEVVNLGQDLCSNGFSYAPTTSEYMICFTNSIYWITDSRWEYTYGGYDYIRPMLIKNKSSGSTFDPRFGLHLSYYFNRSFKIYDEVSGRYMSFGYLKLKRIS